MLLAPSPPSEDEGVEVEAGAEEARGELSGESPNRPPKSASSSSTG